MSKIPARPPAFNKLLAHALAMPGAWEDHPWDHSVAKVGKKVFVFLGMTDAKQCSMSVKLPASGKAALLRDDCEPTGYGLGKAGWVSFVATPGSIIPPGMLERWIEESWCAIAPKKDVARWMGVMDEPAAQPKPERRAKPAPKPPSKLKSKR